MALALLPEASALYGPQAAPDNVDFAAIVAGIGWTGVVSGCGVTAQGAPNMTVAVAAGTVAIGGAAVTVAAVAALTIGAAGAADRRDIVVVNSSGTVSVVAGTSAGAVNGTTPIGSRDPGKPAIPASSVILAEVYVAANTTSIATGNITDKSLPIPTTAPAGLTIPAGQSLVTGTRGVFGDSRAVTTNASDTVNLGTFATTGGALELRIHAYLAAPAAGTTASVTKVYEIAAGALMGTVSTWYLCLPADASANAAAANDFALEVQRTAAGTFQFRFRQKAIGLAGTITFVVENLGDTVVTFTKSTTVTAAPTAVTTAHPSNSLTAAAGNVGVGTEAPAYALDVQGTVSASDVQINDNGTARSAPRGTIGVWRQGATTGTTISASTAETAIFSGVGSFAFVSGRRYRISVRLAGTVTTASASARLVSWVKLGAGTSGTGIAEAVFPIDSTAAGESFMYWGEGVAGTDFAAGTTSLSITASFSSSNTFTPLAASNPPIVSSEILVEDIGT